MSAPKHFFDNWARFRFESDNYQQRKSDPTRSSIFHDISILNAEKVKGFIQGNVNNAISRASGKWIKILFSDDFFFDKYSLENIYFQIKKHSFNWGVVGSLHFDATYSKIFKPIIPYFQKNILEVNTI